VVLIREMDRVPWEFGPEFEGMYWTIGIFAGMGTVLILCL